MNNQENICISYSDDEGDKVSENYWGLETASMTLTEGSAASGLIWSDQLWEGGWLYFDTAGINQLCF